MKQPFYQGYLDSLCGVYSIVNAHRIVTKCNQEQSQLVFNSIIEYLAKKRKLKETLLEGINHKMMSKIIYEVMPKYFSNVTTNLKGFYNMNEWWNYSKSFLDTNPSSCIILSLSGIDNHLTVIESMTDKTMLLQDSTVGAVRVPRSKCKLYGYNKLDKYVVFYSQSWYLK